MNPVDSIVAVLRDQQQQLEQQLTHGWQAYDQQSQQLAASVAENVQLKERNEFLQQQLADAQRQRLSTQPPPPVRYLSCHIDILQLFADKRRNV